MIYSVESGDAGEYICVDDDGLGTRRSAQLVVLGLTHLVRLLIIHVVCFTLDAY